MPMADDVRLAKNKRIKEAGKATRERRALMDCRVYHLKLKPNKAANERLTRAFLEAKWLRNAALAAGTYDEAYRKGLAGVVPVKTPKGIEPRSLSILGSQLQQGVLAQLRGDLKALSASKRRGRRVGKLKFVKEVNSLNLQQLGTTYAIDRNRVRLQGMGWMRVLGLHQLDGAELANAKILQKPDGFYLAVTCYFPRGSKEVSYTPGSEIGIDLGVATHVTLSNGKKMNSLVQETDRLRRLQRKLSRQEKGSKNRARTQLLIRREYQKMDYKKQDFANKVVHELLRYETVYFQDESLTQWKVRYGRSLQHSALGRVKAKLVASDRAVMLDKWVPTTQACECGALTRIPLSVRVFTCSSCGRSGDRDVHAAENMIRLAKEKFYTPGTGGSACGGSVRPVEALLHGQVPVKQETPWTSVPA